MMAATLADGTTVLDNAAREPEIVDLADCLNAMGARITGAGTDRIVIEGVSRLSGATHAIMPDRIETGTFLVAAAATGGDVALTGARPDTLGAVLDKLGEAGVAPTIDEARSGSSATEGSSRYRCAPRLSGVSDRHAGPADGADDRRRRRGDDHRNDIREPHDARAGVEAPGCGDRGRGQHRDRPRCAKLTAANVMATDLRASAGLVIAGLIAEGETVIDRIYHLDRGYERIEDKLSALGARIRRVS
jgi:UDP-N-acetylglucosamine 1-carboxyvinyltransferase